jgi:LmbE family N-acetylglucosaminyl deacetylase
MTIKSHEQTSKELRSGDILMLAPHMDDEVLACGGTMLLHQDKAKIHCLFATDGSRSPEPLLPWTGNTDPTLPELRRTEAVAALSEVGVPHDNLIFLNYPDSRLSGFQDELASRLTNVLDRLAPEYVLAPFRFDVHPDHTAVNRAIRKSLQTTRNKATLLEYFVYYRLRLLRERDGRKRLSSDALFTIDTSRVAAEKQRIINIYKTQTATQYGWQEKPILSQENIRETCQMPEYFLLSDPTASLLNAFPKAKLRVLLAYLAERHGKRPKDRLVAFSKWCLSRGS